MGKVKQSWFVIGVSLILLILTQLPYYLAFRSGPPDSVFGGFLINPLDGNSYIAKMYEGYRGDWLFTLPFTAEKGRGTFIFFFYILQGQLARLFHLPLIFVFHFVRAICSITLVFSLSHLISVLFTNQWSYRFALVMACFGAGMGWLVMPSGYITSDFWVAEAYPFLSSFVNPHFCLSIALMLWITRLFIENQSPKNIWRYLWLLLASFVLGLLAPFALIIVLGVNFILILIYFFQAIDEKRKMLEANNHLRLYYLICVIVGGAPILLYEFYIVNIDPILRGWQTQNITPSPPFWDILLSLSPLLLLAIFGIFIVVRQKLHAWYSMVAWLVIGIVFVYLPWSLQRRFLFGLFVPIVLLAALVVQNIKERTVKKGFWLNLFISGLFVFSFTTNLLLEFTTFYGIKTKEPLLFLTQNENQALNWIEGNTSPNSLFIASPQMGLFIPAHTGRRVIYGHPFETIDAENREAQIKTFYSEVGSKDLQPRQSEYLLENEVDYIFWGPRERSLSGGQSEQIDLAGVTPVFQANDVFIYKVNQ